MADRAPSVTIDYASPTILLSVFVSEEGRVVGVKEVEQADLRTLRSLLPRESLSSMFCLGIKFCLYQNYSSMIVYSRVRLESLILK